MGPLDGGRLVAGPPQVRVQLPVGKPGPQPVCDVHGESGLAQPARPGDQRYHHRTGAGVAVGDVSEPVAQVLDLFSSPGEVGNVSRQL